VQVGTNGGGGSAAAPILELKGISKSFGAVEALRGIDFEVYPAEVVALVGDNGAGKSTLVKTIAGTHQPDAGTIWFDGEEVKIHTPSDATRLGVDTVYQDLALCDNLDVVENMFLGRENVTKLVPLLIEPLSELEMEKRSLSVLSSLNVTTIRNVRIPVAALSGGPAPVGCDLARRHVEFQGARARRTDGRTRRRTDRAGSRADQAPSRAGTRGGCHLAQPPRGVRGR